MRTKHFHAKLDTAKPQDDKRSENKGRSKKLPKRDSRVIERNIKNLRLHDDPHFSTVKLQAVCKLQEKCPLQTFCCALKAMHYEFLNMRQKGLMSSKDPKDCVAFARRPVRLFGSNLQVEHMNFCYDVSFYHKLNPFKEAIAPQKKIYEKEGRPTHHFKE